MPLAPFQIAAPNHFLTDTAVSAGFAGLVGVAFSWTVGGVNVVGIAVTASVFLANFIWTVYRHFDAKRERERADRERLAEVARRIQEAEDRGYMRAKLDLISGEIPSTTLKQLRDSSNATTQPLNPLEDTQR